MRFSLIQLRPFESKWRSARLTDEDLQTMEQTLVSRPEAGEVMGGAGGLRKMRFAPPSRHKGKSGSMRVCYAVFSEYARIYLVTLFSKNEKANLSPAERTTIKALLGRIGRALREGEEP